MEGNSPEKILGMCVRERDCREALMKQGERPMDDLFQRRRRGRAVKKRSGSQFNHSALSPSAERKGKLRCECGEFIPKDRARCSA